MRDLLLVVPARGGSKRVPRKNIRPLAGRTLLEWTRDAIGGAGLDAPCVLSTDDEEIAAVGRRLGWLVPFMRPIELSQDITPTVPVVLHALDWFAGEHGRDPGLVMVLQVTSPFRGSRCLQEGIRILKERPGCDAVVAVRALTRHPGSIYAQEEGGLLAALPDEDRFKQLYAPNGALYIIRTAALREMKTLLPPRTASLVMDELASTDIDTEEDWRLAEMSADLVRSAS
jgi:CMP-N-acetylneuraminic acid synthetase